jgi:hypothetical protein
MLTSLKNVPAWFLAALQYGWVVIILILPLIGYFGESWTSVLSFRVADGWCTEAIDGIGGHCFGDYGISLSRGMSANAFVEGNVAATNTPLTVLAFEALRLVPYRVGLSLFLAVMAVGVGMVAWWGAHKRRGVERAAVLFTAGFGSLGIIMSFDRGNAIALFVPLGLLYVWALNRRAWLWAAIALSVMASLKFWGILLIVGLLAKRQFRYAALSAVLTAILYLLPLSLFGGGLVEKINVILAAVTDREYGAFVSRNGVSLYSFAARLNCALQDAGGCNRDAPAASLPYATFIAVLMALLLVVWAVVMLRVFARNPFLSYVPMLALCFLAVPEAAPYNLSITVVMGAILLRWGASSIAEPNSFLDRPADTQRPWTVVAAWALAGAVVLSTLPLPIWSFPDPTATTGIAAAMGQWKLSMILVPCIWTLAIVTSSIAALQEYRDSRRSGSRLPEGIALQPTSGNSSS